MNDTAYPHDRAGSADELRARTQPSLLTIPIQLVVDLHDTPLAIGLYSLIARQYVIAKLPIPLSAPDVLRYDPALSRGAVLRALARLISGGWIIAFQQPGHKICYTPAWGRIWGSPRPWQFGTPLLGRPRRMIVVRLDPRLLDTCMGKITPHPLRTALVARYITQPLLGLADVGAYALVLAGYPAATEPLHRLGLLHDGNAQPLPADPHLLALASQRALVDDAAATLTERGLRRIGCACMPPAAQRDTHGQPLFFVPAPLIGTLIGTLIDPLIGQPALELAANSASESAIAESAISLNRSHGLDQKHEQKEIHLPAPRPSISDGGGKIEQLRDTEAAQALRAINVLPAQIAELADLPLELIRAAICDGQARPGVRNLAGWVVHLLRNARDHNWIVQPVPPHPDSPEALRAAFARYALAHAPDADAHAGCTNAAELGTLTLTDDQARIDAPGALDWVRLWEQVLMALQAQVGRQAFQSYLQRARLLGIADGVATIGVPDARVKEALETHYIGQVRDLLGAYLERPPQLRIVVQAPVSAAGAADMPRAREQPSHDKLPVARSDDTAEVDTRPEWITPARWHQLSRVLRSLLLGSTLEAGALHCKTPYLMALVQNRYAAEVAALIASVDELIEPSIISFIAPGAQPARNDYAPAVTAS
jgi:hypothetical protein